MKVDLVWGTSARYEPWYDAAAFGAVADGLHCNFQAIQKAIDMAATTEADNPVLKHTPGGWMAEATDSPLIAVVADTEAEAMDLFRVRRAVWRAQMAEAASKEPDDTTEIG